MGLKDPSVWTLPVANASPVSIFLVDLKRNLRPDIDPLDAVLNTHKTIYNRYMRWSRLSGGRAEMADRRLL
jgi:hypothetical protein